MKYLIPILILAMNTSMYSQIVYLLDESFENELSESWTHCSGNWGELQQWSTMNGYLKESAGPHFGRVLNGVLIPHVDLEEIENPILEIEYALGEIDSLLQLSIYYTSSDSCTTIWDDENNGYLLENWNLIANFYKTNDISDNDWIPDESDFQTIQIELASLQIGTNARIGIVSDYYNYFASGNWYINSLKIYGNSTTSIINQTLDDNAIDLFPNPSNQTVNIVLNNDRSASKLMMFNTAGQLVYSNQKIGNEYQIDVSNYSEGMYILQVVMSDEILTKKFVVK